MMGLTLSLALCIAAVSAIMTFPDCVGGPEVLTGNKVCDTSASPAERAQAFIESWTIEEKLANLVDRSPGVPRLGIAHYDWWNEALHGLGYSPGVNFTTGGGEYSAATSFASPITLSAAFDDDLVHRVATVISTEARAFSNAGRAGLDYWTPNINPYKDPRWGRGAETPGEDPFRIKGYVKALISGLQGDEDTTKVIATCKHYAANDLDRWTNPEAKQIKRYDFDAVIGMQDLVEYYLPPFEQCARDSKVKSFMCSYNSVNGTPACGNTYLIQTILRDFWGWTDENQYITSDCNAVVNFYEDHNYTDTAAEAVAFALTAGTDTICEVDPVTDTVGAHNQSLLDESVIDQALRRQYEGLVRAGFFDPAESTPYRSLGWKDVNTPEAQALALQSAIDGMVLKKNDGFLPMTDTKLSVALVGFWAEVNNQMLGGYSGAPPYLHSPVYAARQRGLQVYHAYSPVNPGPGANDTWTAGALEAGSQADVVIYFGGNNLVIESEDRDRQEISWPQVQLDLIQELCSLGKPCVVVELGTQNDDSPLLENRNVSAVLWAGFPGQDGGTAVLDTITGKSAPAGRLPSTVYPADYVYQVPMTDMSLRPGEGNPGRTYKWYSQPVLPFAFGMHYTTFVGQFSEGGVAGKTYAIDEMVQGCSEVHLDLCPFQDVQVSVENMGNITSDYVALVFLSGEYGPEPYPIKELVGYSRIRDIEPADTKETTLGLTLGNLARVDQNGNTVLYPGTYDLVIDVTMQDLMSFELTGEPKVLVEFPQPPADLGEGNGHDGM